jgi:ApbE superfamily uncharacterized protein (UPF0280 family)
VPSAPEVEAYRSLVPPGDLHRFGVALRESDLLVACDRPLPETARAALAAHRRDLERYLAEHPGVLTALAPVEIHARAPGVVRAMAAAARAAGVGPMAAVAGALAGAVGQALLAAGAREVIVENGGDLFVAVRRPRTIALEAGRSPFSLALGLRIDPATGPVGIATSSGTCGGSLSFGRADAACVVARSPALADAAATAVGNTVADADAIPVALERARGIPGVLGALVIAGDRLGAWGAIELVELRGADGRGPFYRRRDHVTMVGPEPPRRG